MGSAYLRYSFTKGTVNEVDALIDLLGLRPGHRVLDVGCGPGRHGLALAAAGIDVVGIDVSSRFVELATEGAAQLPADAAAARFHVVDARQLADDDRFVASFDAVISLCQGAFGLAGGEGALDHLPGRELDEAILSGIGGALRPGGLCAVSAFSAYFQVRYLEDQDTFDVDRGVNHETTAVHDGDGAAIDADLWTTCFTPRELRLLARVVGLQPVVVHGVTPGDYGPFVPSLDRPEFLLVAQRPVGDEDSRSSAR